MKYSEVRSKIKSGDTLAWTHRSWKSWYDIKVQLVRIFTQSEYCHTGTAWVYGGRVFVIEAVIPTIRIIPLSNVLGDECYWIPNHPHESDRWSNAEEFAMGLIGAGEYSQLEAIASLVSETPENTGKWFCSKLSRSILSRMGVLVSEKSATPSNIVDDLLDTEHTLYKITK